MMTTKSRKQLVWVRGKGEMIHRRGKKPGRNAEVLTVEYLYLFFFQAEDGIRDYKVTGVQTCALPISEGHHADLSPAGAARAAIRRVLLLPRPAHRRRGRPREPPARGLPHRPGVGGDP